MSLSLQHFVVPDPIQPLRLMEMLQGRFRVRLESAKRIRRTVYDTFDWLLYQNGARLVLEQNGSQRTLEWTGGAEATAITLPGMKDAPLFAHDLPPSEFRDKLSGIIDVRALRPKLVINSHATSMSIANEEDKALVRLVFDEMTCRVPGSSRGHRLCKRLTVKKIKGYDSDFDEVAAYIEEQSLLPAQNNLLKLALLTLGIAPAAYSSTFKVRLDPDLPASLAARKVLRNLLDVIELNRDGSIEGVDTEFLHDLRVAVRKSRSALTRIKQVFPERQIKRFREGFAWLGQVTTPVRDLDVYLLGFDAYRNSIEQELRPGLEPLHGYLRRQREYEQKKLAAVLQSGRYRKFVADWRAFLTHPAGTGTAPNAERSIFDLADEFIWKLYRKVLKEGKAIGPKSPDEDLHELRKTCKKLRYLMEFFQSLYPAREIRDAIRVLKRFQTLLGEFQDYSVQVSMLKRFRDAMRQQGVLTEEAVPAMRALIKTLQKKQKMTRKHFAEEFELFAAQANQDEFRQLFLATQGGAETEPPDELESVA